jgi:hypothetical protein
MSKPVLNYVAKQYGGARQFRALKRRQLRQIKKMVGEFRCGSAFFPGNGSSVTKLEEALDDLGKALSREVWGQ